MASLMGSEAAIPAKASAYMLSAQGTFSITHSSSHFKVSRTLIKY